MLRCEIGNMRVYGKRRYIKSRILIYVRVFWGEFYRNCIFLPRFEINRIGRSENRPIKQNLQCLCHPKNHLLYLMIIAFMDY